MSVLARLTVDIVVADSSLGVPFLDELEQRSHQAPRVVLFGEQGLDELLEAMGDERVFVPLDERTDIAVLTAKLEALVQPRHLPRYRPGEAYEVRATTAESGRELRCRLLDISSRGLALWLSPQEGLESLLPGTRLSQVSVWRREEQVMGGVAGIVRHLRPLRRKAGDAVFGYQVGLELVEEPHVDLEAGAMVREPLRCASMLRQSLRRRGLSLQRVDELEPLRSSATDRSTCAPGR